MAIIVLIALLLVVAFSINKMLKKSDHKNACCMKQTTHLIFPFRNRP